MKRFYHSLILLFVLTATLHAQGDYKPSFSVLGDSYSTFKGYIEPSNNSFWYPRAKNDCVKVEQTWWYILAEDMQYRICKNNSYSGATISNTGYRKENYSDRSFTTRMTDLGSPDIIFVFGGTNDSWAKSPIGEYKYDSWAEEDLFLYRPALAYMLDFLTKRHINTKLYFILNSELSDQITASTTEVCRHYNVHCIQLHDIDKQLSHPSTQGMRQIAEQIKNYIKQHAE